MNAPRPALPTEFKLDPETLEEIRRGYQQILAGTRFGVIHIRIEDAGGRKENQFVSVEEIKKTK